MSAGEPAGLGTAGPGSGADGVPAAIALSPILSARYRAGDIERIRAAAPGSRIVTLSVEGLSDEPVERRGAPARLVVGRCVRSTACPRPAIVWVHSASAGVERALTPASRQRGIVITNARGVFSRPSPNT